MKEGKGYRLEGSLILTVLVVLLFFTAAIGITVVAPRFVDQSWLSPSSSYQVQMYEVLDPNLYISNTATGAYELQFAERVKNGFTLLGFVESDRIRIISPKALEKYVTRHGATKTILTHRLLLTREVTDPKKEEAFRQQLIEEFQAKNPNWKEEKKLIPDFQILELYDPGVDETFVFSSVEGSLEWWTESFHLIDNPKEKWHMEDGVLYVKNPQAYKVKEVHTPNGKGFIFDSQGQAVGELSKMQELGFVSRKELIEEGEHIYAIEGCWYCHTDQTRTLVQDVVLNGMDSFPAPPSSANEYIYQRVTFPGTKRNGPDLSRTGVKRPSRDWHKSHFWAPKTVSAGSIMPSFHHFFDNDPRGTSDQGPGVPNRKFEAIYQYLMTKGTRITPPTQAWWLGKDPIHTKELIEGKS